MSAPSAGTNAAQAPVWWALSPADCARRLGADLERGLSESEARARLESRGRNELPERGGPAAWELLRRQFSSLVIWVLVAAGAVSAALGHRLDASAIFLIVALNAAVGFLQERKAERALSALRRLSAPSARVLREAVPRLLPAAELVPGDLVPIETGDRIPADGRIVWTARLRTAEAALTGESLPSEKSAQALEESRAPLAERSSMAYLGTTVADGRGLILVTATGLETELGRIAALLGETRRPSTPLEARLERLGRLLVGLFLGALSLIFVLGVARGRDIGEMLVVSLSLAVAAIPEGLPAVVTIALALGVQKMAQRRALVRRLASVETLGCATIICADKTGTLTRNEMNVRRVWACGREFSVTGVGYEPEGSFLERGRPVEARAAAGLEAVLRIGVLCNGAALYRRDGAWKTAGDPTEAALLAAGAKAGLWKEELERRFPALEELPFDPERKLMSVLRGDGGRRLLFVKGAPATVLQRCDRWLSAEGEVPLTDEARRAIAAAAEAMGAQALRVLAMAWRELPEGEALDERSESRLLLAGLAGMIDPARPEAAAAVAACRSAGIRPVMITGDQIATGLAVARETGLLGRGGRTLAGAELDAMSDEDLRRAVAGIDVYARASSQHKLRIVRAWKARGAVVAMTGDGINDAPALREADIGVAMGLSGTDVAREAADLVIADDNFATLVAAVEQGRGIYDSILKAVVFLISANVAELLAVSAPLLLGLTYADGSALLPLTAAQILWVNLVTDGLPALALAADPPAPGVMRRPPRGPDEPLLPPRLAWLMAGPALLASGAALAACLYAAPAGPRAAQSLTLTALVVSELLWSLLIRGAFGARLFTNPAIWAALGGSLALQAAILYLPPLSGIFGVEAPSAEGWILIAALVLLQACAGWALNRWVVIPNWNNRC